MIKPSRLRDEQSGNTRTAAFGGARNRDPTPSESAKVDQRVLVGAAKSITFLGDLLRYRIKPRCEWTSHIIGLRSILDGDTTLFNALESVLIRSAENASRDNPSLTAI